MSENSLTKWHDVQFGELCCSIVNGGTPQTNNASYWNGSIPWITGADFTSHGVGEFRRYVSDAGIRGSATSVVKAGNLLIVTRTGVGKLAIAPCDIAISQDITGAYIDTIRADTVFMFYLLSRELHQLKKLNQGTSINGIIRADLEKYLVRIPINKLVQGKIAHILKTIDQAIEKTEALIHKYQQIKAGLMNDLFTRGLLPDGSLRPPREQAPDLYQDTPIGWVPKEWKIVGIEDIANVVDPNPSHRNPIYNDDGFPFISTVEFLESDEVEVDTTRRVIEEIVEEQERRCKFSAISIAFSRKGTIAEIRFLPSGIRFALLDSLCVINPKKVIPSYLFHALRSEYVKLQIRFLTMGQALPQMSIGRVRGLNIPYPMNDYEQKSIGVRLDKISDYIKTNEAEKRKLNTLKSGLMHDLLTGKVPVKIDPAETTHGS